jgi:hypothetical protein
MSKINVNTVDTQCGSTLTLGSSGKTVTLASGASQSGFGRTGTVDWCTTAKTSPFTSVSGNGYFVNTTSGAVTVTLPASPSAGDIVAVSDYAKTAGTNNITICRNSSKIEGSCGNKLILDSGDSITLVYVDGTRGWKLVNTADQNILQGAFVEATGGTVLTCGDFKTHVFTSDGTFEVTSAGTSAGSNTVEYLVVAGGGGGGDGSGSGAGGGGGYRQNYPSPVTGGISVPAQSYSITVGAGGAFSCSPTARGSSGANSVFSTITSTGGGGGGSEGPLRTGADGGSGGGGNYPSATAGGSGNTPPTPVSQGNNGGAGGGCYSGGGGGGAGAVGFQGKPLAPGAGGAGSPIATAFFGPTAPSYGTPGPAAGRYFAGGGGGGTQPPAGDGTTQAGGAGGGGNGAIAPSTAATTGTVNTGGGGGGGISAPIQPDGSGGSGFVAIRYKFQ